MLEDTVTLEPINGGGGAADLESMPAPDASDFSDGSGGNGATSGNTAAAQYGKAMHAYLRTYLGSDWRYEVSLGSAGRADAVNFHTDEVAELKPDTPRQIQQGLQQLNRYMGALEKLYGRSFTPRLITYKPYKP